MAYSFQTSSILNFTYALWKNSVLFYSPAPSHSSLSTKISLCFFHHLVLLLQFSSVESYREIHLKAAAVTSGNSLVQNLVSWLFCQISLPSTLLHNWLLLSTNCYRIDCYWSQSVTDFRIWHHLSLLKKNTYAYSFQSFPYHAPSEGLWLWNGFRLFDTNGASWLTAKLCQIWVTGLSVPNTLPFILLLWPYSLSKKYCYLQH